MVATRIYICYNTIKKRHCHAIATVGGYALVTWRVYALHKLSILAFCVYTEEEGFLMNVDTFMTIMSFGLACFMAGVAYGKDHGNKKKK